MKIGAQLYTVRDFCKTKEDLGETLQKIADIGYQTVQVSGTCEYDPKWLSNELKKNGLRCVLTHIPKEKLLEYPQQVALDHQVFDCNYVGLGSFSFREPEKNLEEFLNLFTPVADSINRQGKYFMYHNHAREFQKIGGKTVLEHLAEGFPAHMMGFTLDTYWAQFAGADPADWIEKLSGRVPCIHLKDQTFDQKMAVIGEGNINFDRVFMSAQRAGTQYMLVEQDDCNGENPFDCLKRSYEFLKSRGFK
ncbi:MAG: sugar phosphate isomerase/epimerase [Clostridia bacterium]|nr:sugar phosphate isomerase/epimerase [Clostridia bacterium]